MNIPLVPGRRVYVQRPKRRRVWISRFAFAGLVAGVPVYTAFKHVTVPTPHGWTDRWAVIDHHGREREVIATVVFLTSGTSWATPSDWDNANNKVECVGAGGGAGDWFFDSELGASAPGGGGGGGAYSAVLNLTLAGSITYAIGAGGADGVPGPSTAGGDTWFNGASLAASSVGAKGGGRGTDAVGLPGGTGGVGGAAASGIGTTKYSGGNGASGANPSNAGGGAAGQDGAGTNASGATTGKGNNNVNPGTNFDATHGSGNGGAGNANGALYGGGGGDTNNLPGAGAAGLIVITYTPFVATVDQYGYRGRHVEPRHQKNRVAVAVDGRSTLPWVPPTMFLPTFVTQFTQPFVHTRHAHNRAAFAYDGRGTLPGKDAAQFLETYVTQFTQPFVQTRHRVNRVAFSFDGRGMVLGKDPAQFLETFVTQWNQAFDPAIQIRHAKASYVHDGQGYVMTDPKYIIPEKPAAKGRSPNWRQIGRSG